MKRLLFKQKARWLAADLDTPISLYMRLVGASDGILLESAEVDGRWGRHSILAHDMLMYIRCHKGMLDLDIRHEALAPLAEYSGQPFLPALKKALGALEIIPADEAGGLPPITRALYGYFSFEMAALFNPVLQRRVPAAEAQCLLALPASVLVFDHLYNRLCRLDLLLDEGVAKKPGQGSCMEKGSSPQSRGAGRNITQSGAQNDAESAPGPDGEGYKACVRKIKRLLTDGEAIQVVPSSRFSIPFNGDPFTLYRNMRRHNASPYMFYMRFPDLTLFGSSPEVMIRCSENALQLSPIAGTRRRGRNDKEDEELAAELLADPKERAEHVMLVDLGRNDLGKIAETGSVKVEKSMEIERFSHVMHLTSSVTARLDVQGKNFDAVDILAAAFPAGTVSGAPKIRAIEIIRELEGEARGPYAGCVGWIGLDKDSVNMDMGITIRSMWLKDGVLHWQTGGGIVHDSDPDLEWKEVRNKSAIMRLALSEEDEAYVPVNR